MSSEKTHNDAESTVVSTGTGVESLGTTFVSPVTEQDVGKAAAVDEKMVSPVDEKEVVRPLNDTDKQAFSRSADSGKEVAPQPSGESDTDKIFVPQAPPISMEKEVSMPVSGEAQAITTPLGGADTEKFPLLHRTSTTGSGRTLHAGFRLEKKHNLGLIWYLNQQIACRMVDLNSGAIGPAAFVTSSMAWLEVMTGLPPMFELYVPGGQIRVSRFIPLGLQGLVSMKGSIECVKPGSAGELEKWNIKRRGIVMGGREYSVTRENEMGNGGFVWKGSTKVVKEVYSASGAKESVKHGSLKLVTQGEGGEVLAVWNQWRDSEVLGDLIVFDGVVGKISVEVIVTSALAVVHAERATGMNWLGGLGK
ncbi:uncharacterized protein HMPREF1541_02198 [Cyphellophora europaea CBS 101466]|uniref:Uncharacterized protein n=1 Tax=Cyphellophora europaea (strain CBS 101466) TaxID=1220924 RepID=W2S357_CYPE1|nr:uncharacterized protein HMPREF1541_02198 [Cyphellophora europaea CBS 101466]ETN43040.1 hypothetical protein HMPREF1541_02198 [Cyphellophora europaea CBS 101466]